MNINDRIAGNIEAALNHLGVLQDELAEQIKLGISTDQLTQLFTGLAEAEVDASMWVQVQEVAAFKGVSLHDALLDFVNISRTEFLRLGADDGWSGNGLRNVIARVKHDRLRKNIGDSGTEMYRCYQLTHGGESMNLQSILVYGPNLDDVHGYDFHVHAKDCQDNQKYAGHRSPEKLAAASRTRIVEHLYEDQLNEGADFDACAATVHFFPCTEGVLS